MTNTSLPAITQHGKWCSPVANHNCCRPAWHKALLHNDCKGRFWQNNHRQGVLQCSGVSHLFATSFFVPLRWLTRTSKCTTEECLRCSRITVFTTTLGICSQTTNHLRKCSCREYSRRFRPFIAVQTAEPHDNYTPPHRCFSSVQPNPEPRQRRAFQQLLGASAPQPPQVRLYSPCGQIRIERGGRCWRLCSWHLQICTFDGLALTSAPPTA